MHIAAIVHKLSPRQMEQLRAGDEMQTKPKRLSTRGGMKWPSTLSEQKIVVSRQQPEIWMQNEVCAAPREYVLTCPSITCGNRQDVAKRRLRPGLRWAIIVCTHCGLHASATRWTCDCNLPWHACPTHRGQGFMCGTSRVAKCKKACAVKVRRKCVKKTHSRRTKQIGRSAGTMHFCAANTPASWHEYLPSDFLDESRPRALAAWMKSEKLVKKFHALASKGLTGPAQANDATGMRK